MISTASSDVLLEVKDVRVFFELNHYTQQGVRDVFVSAVSHPFEFLFKNHEYYYVLDGVSFQVERGMRVGILGVNGTGKTTLCRCIAGMMKPQQGTITTSAEIRAIFDTGTGIMPELTGRENALLLAHLFFPREKDLKKLVSEAIEFSELGHFIDIPFKQYSKGMQSRLLLSLISSKPTDILILDEVFDGADVFFQKKIAARMRGLIQSAGATIFVSHSMEQIRDVCNKVLVLNKGKIAYFGDMDEGIKTYVSLGERTAVS